MRHIIIVGHGYSPYLVGLIIGARLAPLNLQITLVEIGENHNPVLGGYTGLRELHEQFNIEEEKFVAATGANIHYGTRYLNQSEQDPFCFFTRSEFGAMVSGVGFQHLYPQLSKKISRKWCQLNLTAALAKAEKMCLGTNHQQPQLANVSYDYSVKSVAYRRFLKNACDALGFKIVTASVGDVTKQSGGRIESIQLSNGDSLNADGFIDCSETGVLLDHAHQQALSRQLNTVASQAEPCRHPLPYSVCRDRQSTSLTMDYFFKGEKLSVHHEYCTPLTNPPLWQENVIPMGSAAGCRGGLVFDVSHQLIWQAHKLVEAWPMSEGFSKTGQAINAQWAEREKKYREIYAYHFSHDQVDVDRLQVYRQFGRVAVQNADLLAPFEWPVLFAGLGVEIEVVDPLAQGLDQTKLATYFSSMERAIAQVVQQSPDYAQWLDTFFQPE